MKSSTFQFILAQLLLTAIASTVHGVDSVVESVVFNERGVIVDVHSFFTAVDQSASDLVVAHVSVAGKALVTEDGVFGFLETPENEKVLANMSNGSVVQVKGKLLREGALLHIDALESKTQVPLIDFARYRTDSGQEVELEGANRCQCRLDVGDLSHSCKLGHLHHLQTADGQIYHYLQFAGGQDFFLGKEFHNEPVSVKARLLPGHYLLVSEAEVGE